MIKVLLLCSPAVSFAAMLGYGALQISNGIVVTVGDFIALGVGASALPTGVLWAIWRKWAATDRKYDAMLQKVTDVEREIRDDIRRCSQEQADRMQVALTASETRTQDALTEVEERLEAHIDRNGQR